MRAQARLDMANGDLQVEARERRGEAGRGVPVDQDHVGLLVLEDGLELDQHVARHVEQRLARLHDRKVVVRRHVEDAKHLVEHLAVLARHGNDGLELIPARLQLVDERAHLDCLRAGAEDEHDFFHSYFLPERIRLFKLAIVIGPFDLLITRRRVINKTNVRSASETAIAMATPVAPNE